MTKYSIDTDPRTPVTVVLAAVAIVLSFTVDSMLSDLAVKWAAPSMFFVFGALWWLYDKFAWKWFEFYHHVPNLAGEWSGELNGGQNPGEAGGRVSEVKVLITQSWTEMEVTLLGGKGAHSVSNVVGVFVKNPGLIEIRYGYSKISAIATTKPDRSSTGFTTLWLTRSGDETMLKGHYFSDNLRSGSFDLRRSRAPEVSVAKSSASSGSAG
jgi:hypothetical protein